MGPPVRGSPHPGVVGQDNPSPTEPWRRPTSQQRAVRVVITRMSHHQPTRDYVARRLAEGKTIGEIARILKRYVAREVYKHLPRPTI